MNAQHKSLLPANATALERAIEAAQARLADVPVPVDTLWDPWRCPAELLPWLAWAWSVDEWDPAWPEEVRRRVIAAAPEVHRLKGTRAAVERALQPLGISAELIEWWQVSPPRTAGTWTLTAWLDGWQVAGAADVAHAARVVRRTVRPVRPLSRPMTLRIGLRAPTPLRAAAAAQAGAVVAIYPSLPRQADAPGALRMGAALTGVQTTTIYPPLAGAAVASGDVYVGGAAA